MWAPSIICCADLEIEAVQAAQRDRGKTPQLRDTVSVVEAPWWQVGNTRVSGEGALWGKGAALLLWRCFHDRFHFRQTLLELAADHLIHVHEQADSLGDEFIFAGHAPRHGGLIALGLKVNSAVWVAAKGFRNSSLILIRSLGPLTSHHDVFQLRHYRSQQIIPTDRSLLDSAFSSAGAKRIRGSLVNASHAKAVSELFQYSAANLDWKRSQRSLSHRVCEEPQLS